MDQILKNVMKRVSAAYTEPEKEEDAVGAKDLQTDVRQAGGPHIIQRYYFYSLSKDSMIRFSKLAEDLKSKPYEMSKKLTTGRSEHRGNHFEWEEVIVKTNLYEGVTHKDSFVAFKAELTPDGGRAPGSGQIYLSNAMKSDPRYKTGLAVTDDFLKDNEIFVQGKDVRDFINIEDEPTTSFFYDGPPTDAIVSNILNSNIGGKSYQQWKQEVFAYYRLWSPNSNGGELRLPDLSVPPDGYLGTDASMKKLESITGINIREEADKGAPMPDNKVDKSLLTKKKDTTGEGVFQSVDTQKPVTKEEITNKFASKEDSKSNGDYSSTPYGGGFSIMQNLVKDQKKKMKIREAAQRVILSSISGPSTSGSSGGSKAKAKATQELTKATQDPAKSQAELNKAQQA